MCGICGFSPSINQKEDLQLIETMKSYLYHRGPDGEGTYYSNACVLGHRRLSIIDLETGTQPMHNEDKTVWIVFNGEIYNYPELWKELEERGHNFLSDHSDTEVIIHGYEEWGTEVFAKLNGIFAVAIWDSRKASLVLARDHVGVKPLYYAIGKDRFIFASEPKAILCHPDVSAEFNPRQMANYFFFRAPIHPSTMFKDIYKLSPGSFLIWDEGKKIHKESVYWRPETAIDWNLSEKECLEKVEGLISESVQGQLISDVPLGVFLSGGVDSSLIAVKMIQAGAVNIDGFVISIEGMNDEGYWSDKVAGHLGITNHKLKVSGLNFLETFNQWAYFNDDPVSDPSALALLLIARHAKDSGKIVMLCGEGGDELFGGYNSYLRFMAFDRLKAFPFLPGLLNKALKISGMGNYRDADYLDLNRGKWNFLGTGHVCSFELLAQIISAELDPLGTVFKVFEKYEESSGEALDRACIMDQRVRLPDDILARTDRASMAVSLEARVPLLDYRLIGLANSIPQRLKIRRFCRKHILKKITSRHVPDDVVYRNKIGFDLPLAQWLKQDLAESLNEYVLKRGIPFLDYDRIAALLRDFYAGRHDDYTDFIWAYLLLEQWHHLWCKDNLPEHQTFNYALV